MYYTGIDPRNGKAVYIPKNPHEKAMQRALIQYRNPKLYDLVLEALRRAGRMDLIGYGPKCLIRPKHSHENRTTVSRRANARHTGKSGVNRKTAEMPRSHKKKKTIRNIHKKK